MRMEGVLDVGDDSADAGFDDQLAVTRDENASKARQSVCGRY